jgi:hypothetical protein
VRKACSIERAVGIACAREGGMRIGTALAAFVAGSLLLCACAADSASGSNMDEMSPGAGSGGSTHAPLTPGTSQAGGAGGSISAGTGGSGDTSSMLGSGGMGAGGATGMLDGGAAGMGARDAAAETDGVDPGAITLTALAANTTVGLEWPRVRGATGYRVYASTTAGVTPQNGPAIDVAGPTYVDRGLVNGMQYHYVVSALLASGEGPASPEASATPAGEWVLEALGSGDFEDIVSGARVPRIPIEKRVHIVLLPEGYLDSELATFHDAAQHDLDMPGNDVDRWQAELFGIEPYTSFRDAFVVWFLPRASSAHIGEGTTAFGDDIDVASGPLWSALDASGSDAFPFPPTTTTLNYLAAFLLFDPARGRAGVSGHTGSCPNPMMQSLRIGCSFGIGHAHEFTHAFAQVADEYMENDNMPRDSGEATNVIASNACADLPWAHLLEGGGINDTPQLVGAFGRPERGFHSELQCLMNGTHDNGQYWCAATDDAYTTLTLRPDRLCNWCRELTAYHVFRRTGLLPQSDPFATWKGTYRMPFWNRHPFFVPAVVPQTLQCNRNGPDMPVYEACMP